MAEVLIQGIEHESEMVLVLEWELGELAIDPACSAPQEWVVRLQFFANVLLQHKNTISLVVFSVGHVVSEQSISIHKSLLVSEVSRVLLHVFNKQTEVLSQILRNLVFASLSDIADHLDQVLVLSLNVKRVTGVYLQSYKLDWVLTPQRVLILCDQHQRQSQVEENRMDMRVALLPQLA